MRVKFIVPFPFDEQGVRNRAEQLLKVKVKRLQYIGNCLVPRRIEHPIYEGMAVGLELTGEGRYIVDGELET